MTKQKIPIRVESFYRFNELFIPISSQKDYNDVIENYDIDLCIQYDRPFFQLHSKYYCVSISWDNMLIPTNVVLSFDTDNVYTYIKRVETLAFNNNINLVEIHCYDNHIDYYVSPPVSIDNIFNLFISAM